MIHAYFICCLLQVISPTDVDNAGTGQSVFVDVVACYLLVLWCDVPKDTKQDIKKQIGNISFHFVCQIDIIIQLKG